MKKAWPLTKGIAWPLAATPRVHIAGRFALEEKAFAYRYLHPTVALHIHDYHGSLRIGERVYELSPGDLTLTPAGVPSWYDLPRPGHHLCVHFYPPRAHAGPFRPGFAGSHAVTILPLHLPLGAWADFATQKVLWVARLHAAGASDHVSSAAASAALQELLLWVAIRSRSQEEVPHPPRATRALERAAEMLDQNLDRPLSVPDLARAVELSQNYLARLFRGRYGVTIPRYLLTRRIERARHLLGVTDLPVRIVAARVGLPDPQHFNKAFRRLTGLSPTAARAAAETRVRPGRLG